MNREKLILKFEEDENEFAFDNKLNVVSDKKLIKDLSKTNVSNSGSSLLMKSMNNTPIYDVIQIKINMSETGVFLVNFDKEKLTEEMREKLIENIKILKNDVDPTKETQIQKIKKLIETLNGVNPIFVSFKNIGTIKFEETDLANIPIKFPLLFLKKPEKPVKIKDNSKLIKLPEADFPLFKDDYLFVAIFSLLSSFGFTFGIFSIFNKESIATFSLIMGVVLTSILFYVTYSTLYHKGKRQYKNLDLFLSAYIFVGAVVGFLIGLLISQKAIGIHVENLNMKAVVLISLLTSSINFVTLPASPLINLIVTKMKKRAK